MSCLLVLPTIPGIPVDNPQRTGANTLHQLRVIRVGGTNSSVSAEIISPEDDASPAPHLKMQVAL